jgi:RNA polymerase sigma factor (sigma-70 family)
MARVHHPRSLFSAILTCNISLGKMDYTIKGSDYSGKDSTMGWREERRRLEAFIEAESESVAKTLRYYVLRAGLASGAGVAQITDELFNDMVVEALRTAGRLKPDTHPKPWLLGIAANLIKRRQTEMSKRDRREPLMRDLYPNTEDSLSDEELFDQFPVLTDTTLAEVEADESIHFLLSALSESDAHILRLAILHDMSGEAVAKELHISAGATRVRLHRALNRLRAVQATEQRDGNDG